jgi:CheY-like chemotaxis protein
MATILLVDDELDLLFGLSEILGEAGYTVVSARNGREALEKLERERVDALVTDVMMPIMKGDELIRAVRENGGLRHLPVLIISAVDQRELARELGCPVLRKPFDLQVFLRAIAELVSASA